MNSILQQCFNVQKRGAVMDYVNGNKMWHIYIQRLPHHNVSTCFNKVHVAFRSYHQNYKRMNDWTIHLHVSHAYVSACFAPTAVFFYNCLRQHTSHNISYDSSGLTSLSAIY